jgi:hypothetical protein
MTGVHELNICPVDDHERGELERALHSFLALEAAKPEGEASSVIARTCALSGGWGLVFETSAARDAFLSCWGRRRRRDGRAGGPTARDADTPSI